MNKGEYVLDLQIYLLYYFKLIYHITIVFIRNFSQNQYGW
jgi:hypothetical protein